ncbi:DUF2207 domain-containing protein [Nonomuraea phyllanthi]|uniref:DUF2207 domain-containing protein n=2 Tax=Nonomuraea phyllanthi TaxID=2219224 RepID=A0A5C4W412_9ACTN|nr:DUF2207 domain-containing protein [Nonomuraea phyllanthi]
MMGKLFAHISVPCMPPSAVTPAIGDSLHTLPETTVPAEVAADGRVTVTEKHTFTWQGPGHGAYLEIPAGPETRVEDVSVSEGDTAYRRGPDTVIGVNRLACSSACCENGQQRAAWDFSAAPGSTRTIHYTLRGAVTVYDGQAFLSLAVWGGNWPQRFDLLRVEIRLPRDRGPGAGDLESADGPALTVDAATLTGRRIALGQARTAAVAFQRGLPDADRAGADLASGGGFLIMLVSQLLDRRRATRSQGRGAYSYGGYSDSGYYGRGGSGTGGVGGGV